MFEKILHGGNFAVCFGTIATTAADLSILGGSATGISALLSAHALIKKDKTLKPLALQMGEAFETAIKASPLGGESKKLIPQLMQKYPVTEDDIATGGLVPADIAAIVRMRIEANKDNEDPGLVRDDLIAAYEAILTQMLTPVLAAPAGMSPLQVAIYKQLLAKGEETGTSDKLRDEGITEKAIIRLAQRIAGETEDVGQAWLELQNAMDIAVRVQREGTTGSNHRDFVDEVLARVAEMARDGAYGAAGDEIDAALAREEEESAARKMKLLDSGAELALLDGDEDRAAMLLIRKADLEAAGAADIAALRALRRHHYQIGLTTGSPQDTRLSIALARQVAARAETDREKAVTLDDLAIALKMMGERSSDPRWLTEAIDTYRAEDAHQTKDTDPTGWAITKTNLGTALRTLGGREGGTARLDEAVAAFRAALEVFTPDSNAVEWAMTQMNLGNALLTLGEREGGTARLDGAVAAYRAALEVFTPDSNAVEWAMTQMNLGIALRNLGAREGGTARLDEAVAAYGAALGVRTKDSDAVGWAMTQTNLGVVLNDLGLRESGTARLDEAVTAYRAALEVRTKDSDAVGWAMLQTNLANVEIALFDKDGDVAHLDRAEAHLDGARKVFAEARADHYLSIVDNNAANVAERRA